MPLSQIGPSESGREVSEHFIIKPASLSLPKVRENETFMFFTSRLFTALLAVPFSFSKVSIISN